MREKLDRPQLEEPNRRDNEVLYGLTNIAGKKMGEHILETIMDTPSIRRVIVFGEPGSNKTTVIGQLAHELRRRSQTTLNVDLLYYDDVFKDMKSPENLGPREMWGEREWELFSDELYSRIEDKTPRDEGEKREGILLVENVAVGTVDRGFGALSRIADETRRQDQFQFDTYFIGLVPDARSQERAGTMRKVIAQTKNSQVIPRLKSEYNIIPVSRERDIVKLGKRIKEIFAKMGPQDKIEEISQEVMDEAMRILEFEDQGRTVFQSVLLPPSAKELDTIEQQKYLMKAYYMKTLRAKLELPADRAVAVFSPYRKDTIHWYLDF